MARHTAPLEIGIARARGLWLHAQRLDAPAPFGTGPEATRAAIEHLGYVQIDTIHVIERAHHHVLWSRIPGYRPADLHHAQSGERSVFEYWTHALAYLPTSAYRHFLPAMKAEAGNTDRWFGRISPADVRRVLARIRREGPLSIRDFTDEPLVEKHHPWASRKPAKVAMQYAFFAGDLAISRRDGMLRTYDLTNRHFGWDRRPRPASEAQILDYLLERALRAQGIVSLESICYLDAPRKAAMAELIARRIRQRRLLPVRLAGEAEASHWIAPETAALDLPGAGERVHILSPFDPLTIQRARLNRLFGHDHRFEAYVPAPERRYGYFGLPVLVGDRIAAVLDLKADRAAKRLEIRQWSWIHGPRDGDKAQIEAALAPFEAFQFGT
ncbi:winged helix-turn-helix domain-containing protein [Rhodobacteraceae bacterium DSL-40]|uniref:winged helix-turn-helix domain-containing protein n=1 Tax=Amaricoccus sp. B4 TaxID=3368557 RepID=UPI000DAB9378